MCWIDLKLPTGFKLSLWGACSCTGMLQLLPFCLSYSVSAHHAPAAFWCFQNPLFDICYSALVPLLLPSSVFVMMSQPWQWPHTWLNCRHQSTPLSHSLSHSLMVIYTSLFTISQSQGAKQFGMSKILPFPKCNGYTELNSLPPNSHASRTSECELIWKWGLCRCNKLK